MLLATSDSARMSATCSGVYLLLYTAFHWATRSAASESTSGARSPCDGAGPAGRTCDGTAGRTCDDGRGAGTPAYAGARPRALPPLEDVSGSTPAYAACDAAATSTEA